MSVFEPESDSSPLPPICAQTQEAMVEVNAPWTDEVTAHLATCPRCREFQIFLPLLKEGVANLPTVAPNHFSLEKVLTAVVQERDHRNHRRRRRLWIGGFAVAASLLLVVGWAIHTLNQPAHPPSETVDTTNHSPTPPSESKNESTSPGIHDTIEQARTTVAQKTREAELALERTLAVLPNPVALNGEDDPIDPALKSLGDVGNSALAGFQPLTQSTKRAFGMFWKEIAPDEPRPPAID